MADRSGYGNFGGAFLSTVYYHYRADRVVHHMVTNAAQQQFAQPPTAVAAYDN